MRNRLKIVAIFIIVFSIVFAFWGKKFIWRSISGAQIIYDGNDMPESKLYKSFNGDYVLLIQSDGEEKALYVIRPNEKAVGIQSRIKFSKLPFCLISFEYPVYPITNDSEKGASINPELIIEDNLFQFTIPPNREIRASW